MINTDTNESKSKMKALIYNGIKDLDLQEKEIPVCGPDDVIVRNLRAGICGSDITAYLYGGDRMAINSGREFGHEMVGYVFKKGENVTGIDVDTRVFVDPNYCLPNQYEANMAGAFSQYVRVQNAKVGYNLYILPDDLSYDDAVLIEPFSVATHGKNTAQVKPNENVLIVGAGTIGLCALSSLIAQGNKNIVVLDIDEKRLEKVERMGGVSFNSKIGADAKLKFLQAQFGTLENTNHRLETDENGKLTVEANPVLNIDVVIDCAGIPDTIDDFMKHAKQHARLCCIAVHKKAVPIRFHEVMSTQCAIMGSRGYEKKDIEEVIYNLSQKNSKVTEIITHKIPLKNAEEAFETASDPARSIKVVVDME